MNRRGFFQTIGLGAIAAAVAKALPTRAGSSATSLAESLQQSGFRVYRARKLAWGDIEFTPITTKPTLVRWRRSLGSGKWQRCNRVGEPLRQA